MTGKNVKERIGLGGMDADRIRAVSYTHLDVYKRQGYRRATNPFRFHRHEREHRLIYGRCADIQLIQMCIRDSHYSVCFFCLHNCS